MVIEKLEQVAKLKRIWNLAPVLQVVQKFPENYCLAYINQLPKFSDLISCRSKEFSKMHLVSCTNTHHDVTDLVNHEMVKTQKLEYLANET